MIHDDEFALRRCAGSAGQVVCSVLFCSVLFRFVLYGQPGGAIKLQQRSVHYQLNSALAPISQAFLNCLLAPGSTIYWTSGCSDR